MRVSGGSTGVSGRQTVHQAARKAHASLCASSSTLSVSCRVHSHLLLRMAPPRRQRPPVALPLAARRQRRHYPQVGRRPRPPTAGRTTTTPRPRRHSGRAHNPTPPPRPLPPSPPPHQALSPQAGKKRGHRTDAPTTLCRAVVARRNGRDRPSPRRVSLRPPRPLPLSPCHPLQHPPRRGRQQLPRTRTSLTRSGRGRRSEGTGQAGCALDRRRHPGDYHLPGGYPANAMPQSPGRAGSDGILPPAATLLRVGSGGRR